MKIEMYTDGGCIGNGKNPNAPGGLGVAIYADGQLIRQHSRQLFEKPNTNQKSELHAAIDGLTIINEAIKPEYLNNDFIQHDVILYSDSTYVINGITDWIKMWKRNGWVNSKKEPVANKELWELLDYYVNLLESQNICIKWTKVKGHSGNAGNELVDQLAKGAMNGQEVYDVFDYNS